MKKIAILQSHYIPWKGYFDLMNMVDEFVLYDDAQYVRRSWHNRNKVKSSQGAIWLTIPINVKGKFRQTINQTEVGDESWSQLHWKTIKQCYSKARYFNAYKDFFKAFYLHNKETNLSSINAQLIGIVNEILGIHTKITNSSDYYLTGGKTDKLLAICEQASAKIYVSGPAARNYFDQKSAGRKFVSVEWMDYSGYPEYTQLYGNFEHKVTILDLIFNEGPNARKYLKSF